MSPRHAGGSRRAAHAAQRVPNWSLGLAIMVAVVLGGALGTSSLAQPVGPGQDPSYFAATGYRVSSPDLLNFFLRHGGVRTFGYPVSGEFPLLGQRVQLFQRQMLTVRPDGTAAAIDILDPATLPLRRIDGLTLPQVDPDLLDAAPAPDAPDYVTQALSFISVFVQDDWNGLPVNFQSTFLNTVSCADAFGDAECDPSALPAMALEVWGLPTSRPTLDPLNDNFVYQRFQRGIMHFSRASGATQGLLVGDWLKRVMIGVDLPPDTGADVRQSRFYAQYAPSRPLALDRPADLPDTSLAQAFHADTLRAAQTTSSAEPTLPTNVAQTATAVALTSVALNATQGALQGTTTSLTATALAGTTTAISTAVVQASITPSPATAVSNIPVVNVGCMGDEQLWFVPRKPKVGTHVDVSVTSQRHHDVRFMRLGGPVDSGPVTERVGPLGFIWTWTIVPPTEEFYEWTFYADGLRPCNTSGFNAYAPLGATATPTITPQPTNTPGTATATPTQTPVPAPVIRSVSPSADIPCSSTITIQGSNFGSPPSSFGTSAILIYAGGGTANPGTVGVGSNTQIRVQLPDRAVPAGAANVQVSNSGGDSNLIPVTLRGCA